MTSRSSQISFEDPSLDRCNAPFYSRNLTFHHQEALWIQIKNWYFERETFIAIVFFILITISASQSHRYRQLDKYYANDRISLFSFRLQTNHFIVPFVPFTTITLSLVANFRKLSNTSCLPQTLQVDNTTRHCRLSHCFLV